jgi:adenine phosphoribosyltransferase
LKKGDRVVMLDDVVSTGGTLRAIVKALKTEGVDVREIIVVVQKTDKLEELEKAIGQKIRTLVSIEVRDGKVHLI